MRVDPWLLRAAATRPDHTAVETPDERLTYRELTQSACAVAGWLRAQGLAAGDRVGIALPPGLAFARTMHACLLAEAVVVPIDPRLSEPERKAIADGCALVLDEHPPPGPPLQPAGHDLDAPALVIHTSGTTAAPKPVLLTAGNVLWSALGSAVALGNEPHDRWLSALPLAHIGGLSILLRSAIYATTAVIHPRFETDRVAHALQHEEITHISVVATMLQRLLDAGLSDPPKLRCALAGGGPVAPVLHERAREANVAVRETYGLSEACSQVTTVPVACTDADAGAGPPLFCTRIQIAADGEIVVEGPTVTRAPLRTGDLGELDERGNLHVTGRAADTIVSGGENVAPAQVEAILAEHPGVDEVAVVGRPHPEWGEAVTAIVVPRPGQAPRDEELRAHCAGRLAPFKVPKAFELRAEPLPRTRSGKLLRRDLTR
jgi:O-succinylbenzoic acid--CoA ligase